MMSEAETFEVLVFCDSGSGKHGARHPHPAVQGFVYGPGDDDSLGMGWTDRNTSKRLRDRGAHVDAARAMVGDEPFQMRKHRGQPVEVRESWNLRCLKCGLAVPIRSERLYPALTAMKDHGITRVGLSQIKAGLKQA